jgi:DNA repair protein RecN (Recombination protein N)
MTADDLVLQLDTIRQEIAQYASMDERLDAIERDRDLAKKEYDHSASLLSQSRKALALQLQDQMEKQLNVLNMAGTRFLVAFDDNAANPSARGRDQVRLLLAPNRGEEAKPLARIASGGESSRLMLALKTISAEHSGIPSMVFDEIDTGISGRTAQVVAEKLWDIARYCQVLCVTHLQQIAAMASSHFLVEKSATGDRTSTFVRQLSDSERVLEISRMISGISQGSASGMTHAQHMLSEAGAYRAQKPM